MHLKSKPGWDDALGVWVVHGAGGVPGTILPGVFATSTIDPAVSSQGLVFGETSLFFKQIIAVAGASAYACIFTYLMLAIINLVTPERLSEEDEIPDPDDSLHGGKAFDSGSLQPQCPISSDYAGKGFDTYQNLFYFCAFGATNQKPVNLLSLINPLA